MPTEDFFLYSGSSKPCTCYFSNDLKTIIIDDKEAHNEYSILIHDNNVLFQSEGKFYFPCVGDNCDLENIKNLALQLIPANQKKLRSNISRLCDECKLDLDIQHKDIKDCSRIDFNNIIPSGDVGIYTYGNDNKKSFNDGGRNRKAYFLKYKLQNEDYITLLLKKEHRMLEIKDGGKTICTLMWNAKNPPKSVLKIGDNNFDGNGLLVYGYSTTIDERKSGLNIEKIMKLMCDFVARVNAEYSGVNFLLPELLIAERLSSENKNGADGKAKPRAYSMMHMAREIIKKQPIAVTDKKVLKEEVNSSQSSAYDDYNHKQSIERPRSKYNSSDVSRDEQLIDLQLADPNNNNEQITLESIMQGYGSFVNREKNKKIKIDNTSLTSPAILSQQTKSNFERY